METTKCPNCGEEILAAAKKCKHCGEWLDKVTAIKTEQKEKLEEKKSTKKKPALAIILGISATVVVVVVILALALTNSFSSETKTDIIKKSILDIDYSISIGEALDNYKFFTKTEWREFTSTERREVVEFKGYYFKNDVVVLIQFKLNKDFKEDDEGRSFLVGYQSYSYESENGEKKEIEDDDLIDMIYKNKEIGRFAYLNVKKKTEIYIAGVNESFLAFLEEFVKNKNSQIALINKPLICNLTYSDEDGEIIEETKHLNETDLEETWNFLEKEMFFDGTKIVDDQQYYSIWDSSSNTIVYELGIPESGYMVKFVFKKQNNKWLLFEYEYNNI